MVYSSGRAYFKSSVDGIMLVDNDKKDPITRKSLLPEGKNNTDIDSIRERERQQNRGRGRGRGREQVKKQQPLGYKDWNLKEAIKEWIFQETGYHLYDLQQAKYRDIIKRARDFFDAKNYDDAMKEYREAYDILPFSFDTNYYHPIDFYRNEEGKDEKKEEEKYNGNGKFQDLINYSDCLFIMQKFSRVSTYFNRIIRIWKKFEKEKDDKKLMTSSLLLPLDKIANIFFNRAWISEHHYCYSGLFIHSSSSIIKDLDMATKLNPNNYAYFQKKGEYQFFVGEDESSVSSFNSAIQLFLSSQFLDESEKEKDKNEKKREKILKNMLIGRANACINVENFQLAYEDFSRILLLPSTSLPLTTSVKEEKSEKNRGEGSKGSKVWEMMENKKKRREFLSIHWGYMKSLFGKKQYDDVLSHYQKLVTIINITESKYEEKSKESKVVDEDHDDDDDDDHYYKNGQDRDSLHIIGFSFYKQGKYSEALNIFDKCLELRGEEMDDDDEKDQLIASTYGHAMSSMMLAEKDKDISLLSECLEKVNRCIELSEGEYTTFFHGRGQLYERMGEFQKAFNNYSQIETVNRRNQLVSEANKINPLFDLDDLELRTKNVIHLIENFPKENEEKILQGKIKL
jgi:tetratricopeptide (TPR) repeat protein